MNGWKIGDYVEVIDGFEKFPEMFHTGDIVIIDSDEYMSNYKVRMFSYQTSKQQYFHRTRFERTLRAIVEQTVAENNSHDSDHKNDTDGAE